MLSEACLTEAPNATLTILIADDHQLVRDGMRMLVADTWPQARLRDAAELGHGGVGGPLRGPEQLLGAGHRGPPVRVSAEAASVAEVF